jgi:hypothetical protein
MSANESKRKLSLNKETVKSLRLRTTLKTGVGFLTDKSDEGGPCGTEVKCATNPCPGPLPI